MPPPSRPIRLSRIIDQRETAWHNTKMPRRSRHKALSPPPLAASAGDRLMSYHEIRQQLRSRGIRLSVPRVRQICLEAERKLWVRLRALN